LVKRLRADGRNSQADRLQTQSEAASRASNAQWTQAENDQQLVMDADAGFPVQASA
jgi:hypothetical protein